MELMKLSKRYKLAKRGHRLRKDKQDDLMDRFTAFTKKVSELRRRIESEYGNLKLKYFNMKTASNHSALLSKARHPLVEPVIESSDLRIMNMIIPQLDIKFETMDFSLGNINISSMLPEFLKEFKDVLEKIMLLVNAERSMLAVAEELEKVRRRVNALEYISIPRMEETMNYITMQLEELEREGITRLMKIKDIVRKR